MAIDFLAGINRERHARRLLLASEPVSRALRILRLAGSFGTHSPGLPPTRLPGNVEERRPFSEWGTLRFEHFSQVGKRGAVRQDQRPTTKYQRRAFLAHRSPRLHGIGDGLNSAAAVRALRIP